MVKSSDLSWIVVSDLRKAREFFTKVVGLKEISYSEDHGWAEMHGAQGGMILGISEENSDMQAGQNAIITFTVSNIEKTRRDFEKKGAILIGDVMDVQGYCKLQMFTDEDGNQFQLVELTENQVPKSKKKQG